MSRKHRSPCFTPQPGAPGPLRARVRRRVRLEEVDALGIVWHGRYASYFEDAREGLTEHFAIGYLRFFDAGVLIPLRRMEVDYLKPLRLRDEVEIEAALHFNEAARIDTSYRIINQRGELCTTACEVQLMVDVAGELLLSPPDFWVEFLARWRAGELPALPDAPLNRTHSADPGGSGPEGDGDAA